MFSFLYNTIFYEPLYNGLIILLAYIPWINVGVAVILFTIIVRFILFPISQKSVRTQLEMKKIEPELDDIKKKYKDDKQLQAQKVMEVYKTKGINPFSGILLLIIQLPILWALYAVFLRGGLPHINLDLLYHFVRVPENVNMFFLGIDVAEKSTLIAAVAALTQFLQISMSSNKNPAPKAPQGGQKPSFKDELAKSMGVQMKFVMPFMIFIVARSFPIVVSLYLVTSNVFSIVQEVLMARKLNKQENEQRTN